MSKLEKSIPKPEEIVLLPEDIEDIEISIEGMEIDRLPPLIESVTVVRTQGKTKMRLTITTKLLDEKRVAEILGEE